MAAWGRRVLIAGLWLAAMQAPVAAQGFRLEFYAEVRELAQEGAYDEAERRLESAFLASAGEEVADRVALLDELAAVQLQAGKEADAGDTLFNKAVLLARALGPDYPELGAVYAASGRAYLSGGANDRAVDALRAALQVDRRYLDCHSGVLAGLYRDLATALAARGDAGAADEARALSGDAEARCAAGNPTRGIATGGTGGEGEFALVDVLYATDRKPTGEERPSTHFGGERGPMSYGTATVSIPRTHKPGNIEAPSLLTFNWQENQALHIVLVGLEEMGEEAFLAAVAASLADGADDGIFLFIHGFNVTFADAAKRTAQLVYDLNFAGTPIFYSWPSRGHPGSYMSDAASVQVSARRLTVLLEQLAATADGRRIEIVAHSMGNRALTEALEIYALRHPDARDVFDQIIFAAPDVDSELFVYQTGVFQRLARRLTLYTSNADLALSTSQQLHGHPRAGLAAEVPLTGDGFDTIDMSVLGAGMLKHSYFAADASALSDMLWLFWRNPPPPSRCGMSEEFGDSGAYWVYVAERCESGILLSALSLARHAGPDALAEIDARIAAVNDAADPGLAAQTAAELIRIREVLAELLSP